MCESKMVSLIDTSFLPDLRSLFLLFILVLKNQNFNEQISFFYITLKHYKKTIV